MSKKNRKKKYLAAFNQQWRMKKDSEHHIYPWSRSQDDRDENKVLVNEGLHEKFHALAINRTPEEFIEFLLDYFFGGKVKILINVLKKKGQWHDTKERRQ